LQGHDQAQNKTGNSNQHQRSITHEVTLPEQFLPFKWLGENFSEKPTCKIRKLANFDQKGSDAIR